MTENRKTPDCKDGSDTKVRSRYMEMLSRVPQSVRDQVNEYRRSREEGRQPLTEQLEKYDDETRLNESLILQVWEMSLQSRPHRRTHEPERER